MNALFYHNEGQKAAAEKSSAAAAGKRGIDPAKVQTEILPVGKFTYAEAYHQKYYLTQFRDVRDALSRVYESGKELADSTVATRINAYLGSGMKKDWKIFLEELPEFGLSDELEEALTKAATKMVAGAE